MAPNNRETKIVHNNNLARLSMDSLQRTISDVSLELKTGKKVNSDHADHDHDHDNDDEDDEMMDGQNHLPAISEEAECECCGMREEWTVGYVGRTRAEFGGKMVCGLCAVAVGEEMQRSGARRDEAVGAHAAACYRFNSLGRAYPCLFQAQAVKEILKRSNSRAKSLSPRDTKRFNNNNTNNNNNVGLSRSSSCIPAITRETS